MNDKHAPIRFELRRLAEYSDDAILAELRRVAALAPDRALLESDMEKFGRITRSTIRRRFGSWFDALEAAGLCDRSTNQVKTRGGHASSRMADAEVLSALRELAEKLRTKTLTTSDVKQHLPFSEQILQTRWRSSRAAFEAAGLALSNLGRRYTDDECFDNLLRLWTHFGRPPMHKEMSDPPSTVGAKAYVTRFGTWNKALAAFVERVNQDVEPDAEQGSDPAVVDTAEDGRTPVRPIRSSDETRDIRLGLRFRVLHRDRFKCVLCGDHPARNPECVLHVGHVMPWSKGGPTSEGNLRTLCLTCNLGRGNRFPD